MKKFFECKSGILINDDCMNIMSELETESIDMILCDLPYGTTACSWDTIIPLDGLWKQINRLIKNGSPIILTSSQPFTSVLVMSNLNMFKCEWIWEKNRGSNFATTKYQPMKEHESVLVFGNGRVNYYPIKEERADGGKSRANYKINPSNTGKREVYSGMIGKDIMEIDKNFRVPRSIQKFNTEVGMHPTQKPVLLFEYFIKSYSRENELILDMTSGSSTTAIACIYTNRKFICIEKDEKYFQISKERIEKRLEA